jgi:hypothetical protein
MKELPPRVQAFIDRLCCGFCGTVKGRGFAVSVHVGESGIYELSTRCLRCGLAGYGRVMLGEETPAVVSSDPQVSDISSDEVLDLHEAMKSDDWLAQLTGKQA